MICYNPDVILCVSSVGVAHCEMICLRNNLKLTYCYIIMYL